MSLAELMEVAFPSADAEDRKQVRRPGFASVPIPVSLSFPQSVDLLLHGVRSVCGAQMFRYIRQIRVEERSARGLLATSLGEATPGGGGGGAGGGAGGRTPGR